MLTLLKNTFHKLKYQYQKRAITLCYHRIADEQVDPWDLAVSPKIFEEQLKILSEHFITAKIPDLIYDFDGACTKRTVCLSFDDGYRDNYIEALPLLKKYNIPATFFIASDFIGKEELFWWDELSDIILKTPILPPVLYINIDQIDFSFSLDENADLSEDDNEKIAKWKYYKEPPTKRCTLFLKLWELIRPLKDHEIKKTINHLRMWSGYVFKNNDLSFKLPLSELELKKLSEDKLVTIGLHTHHHIALGFHSLNVQSQEIKENQTHLEIILKKHPSIISFPYGNYNMQTIEMVKEHQLLASFNSEKIIMTKKSDHFHLGRFTVKNWNGKKFRDKINSWFSKN
jgi:peptidoglycan/xylan/chitin deacetylase (PgdA/CDA1 family)